MRRLRALRCQLCAEEAAEPAIDASRLAAEKAQFEELGFCVVKQALDERQMARIEQEGAGVILYMRQEGRGIGLASKIKAYKLQEEGLDTVDANLKLGYGMDLREYGIGAQILVDLGLQSIRLLTNNPKKMVGLEGYGLKVDEQLPITVEPNPHNEWYLETKKSRMGHML